MDAPFLQLHVDPKLEDVPGEHRARRWQQRWDILHHQPWGAQLKDHDHLPLEAHQGPRWKGPALEVEDDPNDGQRPLPSIEGGDCVHSGEEDPSHVPRTLPVPHSSSRAGLRIHQEAQPEPEQPQSLYPVSFHSLCYHSTSCSNQCLAFIPDLCKTILDMNWQWLPTGFRHVLTSALQFICLQDIWEVGSSPFHSLCFTKHYYHTSSFLFLLLDSYEFSDLENTYFYHYLYQVDYAKGMIQLSWPILAKREKYKALG